MSEKSSAEILASLLRNSNKNTSESRKNKIATLASGVILRVALDYPNHVDEVLDFLTKFKPKIVPSNTGSVAPALSQVVDDVEFVIAPGVDKKQADRAYMYFYKIDGVEKHPVSKHYYECCVHCMSYAAMTAAWEHHRVLQSIAATADIPKTKPSPWSKNG